MRPSRCHLQMMYDPKSLIVVIQDPSLFQTAAVKVIYR